MAFMAEHSFLKMIMYGNHPRRCWCGTRGGRRVWADEFALMWTSPNILDLAGLRRLKWRAIPAGAGRGQENRQLEKSFLYNAKTPPTSACRNSTGCAGRRWQYARYRIGNSSAVFRTSRIKCATSRETRVCDQKGGLTKTAPLGGRRAI
jgi:hypothetical protein